MAVEKIRLDLGKISQISLACNTWKTRGPRGKIAGCDVTLLGMTNTIDEPVTR